VEAVFRVLNLAFRGLWSLVWYWKGQFFVTLRRFNSTAGDGRLPPSLFDPSCCSACLLVSALRKRAARACVEFTGHPSFVDHVAVAPVDYQNPRNF